jgi:2',3'-cyclic-nucleotide 2'-phosphodiesterase (5'-nucleotidase family)
MLSATYAVADKKPFVGTTEYIDDKYGYEVDLTATYKITNNLSYMLGGGYLFTGDYYKGLNDANQIDDDFLVINKLTLTF